MKTAYHLKQKRRVSVDDKPFKMNGWMWYTDAHKEGVIYCEKELSFKQYGKAKEGIYKTCQRA